MMISTKGRYALRVMIDLAEHNSRDYIPLKEIAERQDISLKYLERIVPSLTAAGLVDAVHGKGGGYRLNRSPEEYNVGEILRLMEGDLAPVSCLENGAKPCEKASECRTLPMWSEFYKLVNDYFDSKLLTDLIKAELPNNYVI